MANIIIAKHQIFGFLLNHILFFCFFIFLFFHFLPDPIKIRLVNNFNLGHFEKTKNKESLKVIESCKLIDAHMLKMLFKEGKILSEYFLFLKKSITITNFNEKALQ